MTDPETTAAVEALAHRLRNKGDEDPEVFALEFMTALRGRGWRVTSAKAQPDAHAPGAGLPSDPNVAEMVRRTRADVEATREAFRAAQHNPQDAA